MLLDFRNGGYESYDRTMNFYSEKKFEISNTLDKYLLSFSSGAIAISIAFLNHINFMAVSWLKWIFLFSLFLYLITILFTLLKINFNIKICDIKPKTLFAKREKVVEEIELTEKYEKYSDKIGIVVKFTFLIATFLLILFVGFNIDNIQ